MGGNLNIAYAPVADQRFELTLRSYRETDGRAGGVGGAPGYPFLNVRQSPNDLQMGRLSYSGDFFDGPLKHVEASVYANYFDTHLLTVNTSMPQRIVRQDSHVIGPLVLGGKAFGTFGWDGPAVGRPEHHGRHRRMDGGASGRDPDHADPDPQRRRQRGLYRQHAAGADRARFRSVQCRRLRAQRMDAGAASDPVCGRPLRLVQHQYRARAAAIAGLAARLSEGEQRRPDGADRKLRRWSIVSCRCSICSRMSEPRFASRPTRSCSTRRQRRFPIRTSLPETGLTYEGGFRVNVSNATLKVTAFDSSYKNLILVVPVVYNNSPLFTQNQNVGDARFRAWSSRSAGR